MGQDTRSIFQYLKDAGYALPDRRFPREGPGRSTRRACRPGATAGRRSSAATGTDGKPSPNPADQVNAWKKQVVLCRARAARHGAARSARLPAEPHGRLARSPARRARAAAVSTSPTRTSSSSTSIRRRASRISERLAPILAGLDRVHPRAIDEAAAVRCYALQHEVLAGQGIPVQGVGREAYRS